MPMSPPTRCAAPGCNALTSRGTCETHKRVRSPHETRPRYRDSDTWSSGSTSRWRRVRAAQLARHPDCARCHGPADQVDHVVPLAIGGAKYDPANHQSLCADCHRAKSAAELGKTYAGRGPRVRTYRVDNRVVVVSGSPCSGKTTYVRDRKQPYDIVWDFDAVALALGAPGDHAQPPHFLPFVAEMRDAFLGRLTRKHQAPRVWVVTCDPHLADRLPGAQHVRMAATRDQCMARAVTAGRPHRWVELVEQWFTEHGNTPER
ncbi:HNH endonuclease [Lentzea sp. JNUCC 0626]|uniref:HNH endonuclease n=1 Tax=Lentzea sp. JNUCC 0626 TaxID=3367513 RepID=UPI003749BF98